MKPRITVITIGVDDLEMALQIYRDALGLKAEGIIGKESQHGAVACVLRVSAVTGLDCEPGI